MIDIFWKYELRTLQIAKLKITHKNKTKQTILYTLAYKISSVLFWPSVWMESVLYCKSIGSQMVDHLNQSDFSVIWLSVQIWQQGDFEQDRNTSGSSFFFYTKSGLQ